jgi:DNA-binding transcriptional ArsR family regulator
MAVAAERIDADLDPGAACAVPLVHPDKVALVRSRAPLAREVTDLAALFKLLGDPTRTRILHALLEAGELCVCDLAAATDTGESTVSAALRLLRTAGVVAGRRDGRMVYYRLADAHVRMLLDLSREHARHEREAG